MTGTIAQRSGIPRIAVIGGGINGTGIAWELARRDYHVTLFERGVCGAETSSASTKMIHGGLRYLEHLHLRQVRESLRERAWLLEHAPSLVRPLEIVLPVYDDSPRRAATLRAGLLLYDLLAGRNGVQRHRRLETEEMQRLPLRQEGLNGGFSYWDAQVDDFALVRAVVASARHEGAVVLEQTGVDSIDRAGEGWQVRTSSGASATFDMVINAAGPWMNELLANNSIPAPYVLTLVRGSHLVLDLRVSETGLLLQSTSDRRVFFVLPWKETTLVGTTEVLQTGSLDRIEASEEEVDYLITRFNRYVSRPISRSNVVETFAGVRPLVGRASNPSAIGREFRVVRQGSMIHVFGGKLTTFMSLARRVALRVDNHFGGTREPRPAVFITEAEADPSLPRAANG